MRAHQFTSHLTFIALLVVGLTTSFSLSHSVDAYSYAHTNDSIGHITEVDNLLSGRGLLRFPWGISPVESDLISGEKFPPGYTYTVYFISRLFHISPDQSALLVTRASWALLLPAVYFAVRPLLPFPLALLLAVLTFSAPSNYLWGTTAGSDVPTTVLLVFSFGLAVRALSSARGSAAQSATLIFFSGLLAGIAYAFRNSALSFLLAYGASLAVSAFLGAYPRRRLLSLAPYFLAGVSLCVVPISIRNLLLFGDPQPWPIDRGSYTPFLTSIRILIKDLLIDVTGFREAGVAAWDWRFLVFFLAPMSMYVFVQSFRLYRSRVELRFATILGATYIFSTGSMLVIAHSWSGLDPDDLLRHVGTITWLVWLFIFLTIIGHQPRQLLLRTRALLTFGILLLSAHTWFIAQDVYYSRQITLALKGSSDVVSAAQPFVRSNRVLTRQLKRRMADELALIEGIERLDGATLIASNSGTFLSGLTSRPVRNIPFRTYGQFVSAANSARNLVLDKRPFALVLIPDNRVVRAYSNREWTQAFLAGLSPEFCVLQHHHNYLIMKASRNRPGAPCT